MIKRTGIFVILTAAVMLLLPFLAVTFVRGDGGMAVCFILFFAINPIASVITGIYSGMAVKQRWFYPLLTAIMFLIGTWLCFDMGESAFLLYTAVYLLIGISGMFVTAAVTAKKR